MSRWLMIIAVVLVMACASVYLGRIEDSRRKENPAYSGVNNVSISCIRGYSFAVYSGYRCGGITQMFENTSTGIRAIECKK